MLLDCHTCEEILTIVSSTYCGLKILMTTLRAGGIIMWRSSAYSAAIVCGLKRRASVEHAHSEVASIRNDERRKYAVPCLPSICGTRACQPFARASCRLATEQGPVLLVPPQRSRGDIATRRCEGQVWPGRVSSVRRFYRHSRHPADRACYWAVASAPTINKCRADTRVWRVREMMSYFRFLVTT
jgi:hypothetical protein